MTEALNGADNEMKMMPLLVMFVLAVTVGGIATEYVGVVYGANSHANQSVDQYSVQCSSTLLNINIHNDQRNPIWNNATIIDLVNVGGAYKAAGQTGNAFLGLECDQHWVYGFVAYMPPADEYGQQHFKPNLLVLEFDTTDAKPSVLEKEDHAFALDAKTGVEKIGHGTGTGDFNNGYGGWSAAQLFKDPTLIDFHYSVTRTPFFNLPRL